MRKIDMFCGNIDTSTRVSDLQKLADSAGVDLRGPMMMSNSYGPYVYAIAASGFTVGEYACRIHAASLSGVVSKKRLGY